MAVFYYQTLKPGPTLPRKLKMHKPMKITKPVLKALNIFGLCVDPLCAHYFYNLTL